MTIDLSFSPTKGMPMAHWKVSTHNLVSPFFFLTGTKLATHSKYLKGMMIWASNNFFTSFSIIGNSMGFICLSFCLKCLASTFKGILCSMMLVSYVIKSSYFQENTSTKSFRSLTYSTLCSFDKLLDNLTYFGSSFVP
jgi:hypothetical protein